MKWRRLNRAKCLEAITSALRSTIAGQENIDGTTGKRRKDGDQRAQSKAILLRILRDVIQSREACIDA